MNCQPRSPSFWRRVFILSLLMSMFMASLALSEEPVSADVLSSLQSSWEFLRSQQETASNILQGGLRAAIAVIRPYTNYPMSPPALPSAFWGRVAVDGVNVPAGTTVTVWIDGTQVAQTTTQLNNGVSVYSLDIPADNPETPQREGGNEGEEVRFKIGSIWAKERGLWQGGGVLNQNLSADPPVMPVTRWIANFGYSAGGWTSQNQYPRFLADVNGDGKADIVGFFRDGAYVSLSTGTGFGTPRRWIANFGYSAGGWTSQNQYPRLLADVNGDGKADIVGFGLAGAYVALSTGTSFTTPSLWVNNFGYSAGGWTSQNQYPRLLADVNGDGKADIVGFGGDGTYVALTIANLSGSSTLKAADSVPLEQPFEDKAFFILPEQATESGFAAWRGEYFANDSLTGEPTIIREDQAIDFDWGEEPPEPSLALGNFSARWTRTLALAEGDYTFHLLVKGRARLLLDGQPLLEGWVRGDAEELVTRAHLPGEKHTLSLEYFAAPSGAQIKLWWEDNDFIQEANEVSDDGDLPPTPPSQQHSTESIR